MLAWDSALVTRGCRGRGRVPLGLRQVPHRLSVRWILDTVMMAVQLLLSRRCWLVLASAARCMCLNLQQVGSVLALPFRVVDGRVCLQVQQLAGAAGSGSACALVCQLCTRAAVPVWLQPQRVSSEARRQARSSKARCSSASTAASRPAAPQRSHAGVAWCARRRWCLC